MRQMWFEHRVLIGILLLITLFNSLLILLFSRLTQLDLLGWLHQYHLLPLAPIVGSFFLWLLYRSHQGHTQVGLARVTIGYHFDRIPISWRDMRYQFLGALIAVLSGFAVGIVGPAIYLSGWLASRLAAKANFNWRQQRLALACGCAAAIAVLFASPLGALLLVSESIVRQWRVKTSMVVLFCAILAAGFGLLVGGSVLSINLPRQPVIWMDLDWYIGLGVLAAFSVWFIQRVIHSWPFKSVPHAFFIVAVVTAIAGFWAPELLMIETINANELLVWQAEDRWLWDWFALRTLLTALALAAVVPGGSFGPALVIGGLLGASLGTLPYAPDQSLLIVSGMAAVLSVVFNAPLAATLLMIEHCQQWELTFPALLACLTANLTLKYLFRSPSLLDFQLQQNGICLLQDTPP